jgi:sec-independent protein translocase protein TatA
MNLYDAPVQLALSMPGGGEWLMIFLIVLVVFGHNRIPQLGDALGKGIKNFKKAFDKDEVQGQQVHREVREVPRPEVADQSKEALEARLAQLEARLAQQQNDPANKA